MENKRMPIGIDDFANINGIRRNDKMLKKINNQSFFQYLRQSTFLKVVCIIELLVLAWVLYQCFRPSCNLTFGTDEFTSTNVSEDCIVQLIEDEDGAYYTVTNNEEIDSTNILSSDVFKLYPGAFDVKITYKSTTAGVDEGSYENTTGSLELSSVNHGTFFSFNSLTLRDAYTEESQTVQIYSPTAIEDLTLTVNFEGGGGTRGI